MTNKTPTLMIAVPTTGQVHFKTAAAITHIAAAHHAALVYGCDRPHDRARNKLVRLFLQHSSLKHLLFIDSDVEPPLDVVDKLLSCNRDVVSGCVRIHEPRGFVWAVSNKDADGKYRMITDLPSKDPFDADAAGAGCLLIRRSVLEHMPWPWFRWVDNEDGSQMGEDIYFCKQLNDAGLRVRIDPACVCVHHKTIGI